MSETKKAISQDRKRTNILHDQELALIAYLVERMPRWVTSNMLTSLGLCGNLLVAALIVLSLGLGLFGSCYLLPSLFSSTGLETPLMGVLLTTVRSPVSGLASVWIS